MNPSPDYAMKLLAVLLIASCGISSRPAAKPPSADYYIAPMRKVAVSFKGKPGVVLHIGDSITYANPYGQWARAGQGKSAGDLAILKWMHTGANDDSDGWFLARVDRPGGRSAPTTPHPTDHPRPSSPISPRRWSVFSQTTPSVFSRQSHRDDQEAIGLVERIPVIAPEELRITSPRIQ
jgi:hypothetical protein